VRAGLGFGFMSEDLGAIPFNELVEIPFTVSSMGICDSYKDISVEIIASCEMPSPNSQVFQYGVLTAEDGTQSVSYDLDDRLYASNSSATFNVEWASRRRRRLSDLDSYAEGDAVMEAKIDVLIKMMVAFAVMGTVGFGLLYFALRQSGRKAEAISPPATV
jgi:hypothetical protein